MIIRVTADGFTWTNPQGVATATAKLWGPDSCRYEQLRVMRDGVEIDTASIHHIGTHDSFNGFDGLMKIAGPGRAHEYVDFRKFEIGDELHIDNIPTTKITEEDYWRELCFAKVFKTKVVT